MRPLRSRMAALHRRLEARHLESARRQQLYALRLDTWSRRPDASTAWPTLSDAVAAAIGLRSAAVTLLGRDGTESLAATSDHTARPPTMSSTSWVRDRRMTRWRRSCQYAWTATNSPSDCPATARSSPTTVSVRCSASRCVKSRAAALELCASTTQARSSQPTSPRPPLGSPTHSPTPFFNVPGTVEDDEIPVVSMFDESDFLATAPGGRHRVRASGLPDNRRRHAASRTSVRRGLPMETLAHRVIRGDVQI
jgi:hypothetical protein